MIKIFLTLLCCAVLFGFPDDKLISSILKPQKIKDEELTALKNPFQPQKRPLKISKIAQNREPQEKKVEKNVKMKLKAIFDDGALINDKWLKNGETIEGYKIAEIKIDNVTLSGEGGEQKTIYLKQR